MLILRYFQAQGSSVPNPRGDMALSMSSESISSANKESFGSDQEQWHRPKAWPVQERSKMKQRGVAATSQYLSIKLKKKISESILFVQFGIVS